MDESTAAPQMNITQTATATTAAVTTPATPSAPKPRKPNAWINHVKDYRLQNADRIKTEKLSCGQISKLARETYSQRAKCDTCGK